MKNKKLGIALLTLAIFTTTYTKDASEEHSDFGSNLLFAPALVADMGVDAVTLDQTHQTRKLLDSKDSKKTQSSRNSKSTSRNSESTSRSSQSRQSKKTTENK
jgi:hypothetical protein